MPNGYSPMKTESSILLGTGGDNSVNGVGDFFGGAVISGYPSDATENAVQANLTATGYSFSRTGEVHAIGAGKCLDDPYATATQGTQ